MQNRFESERRSVGNQEVPNALLKLYKEVRPTIDGYGLGEGLAPVQRTKALLNLPCYDPILIEIRRFQKGMSYAKDIKGIQRKLGAGGIKPRKEKFLREHLKRLESLLLLSC
jgi:hypothetical protein